jgi:hypothetical protein
MSTSQPEPDYKVRTDACVYLLHMLVQRREHDQPGYLAKVIQGVESDQQGVARDVPDKDHIDAIFAETLRILKRAKGPFDDVAAGRQP